MIECWSKLRSVGFAAIPIQMAWGSEENFLGVIDLVSMQSISFSEEDKGLALIRGDIPPDLLDAAAEQRTFSRAAAEANDELMEQYFERGELSESEIKQGLRLRVLANEIVLATCGSAFKNKGVQPMLDA